MKLTRADVRRAPALLALSMLGSYACALAFIAVLQWSLPRTDLAYGQGVSRTLGDPFVRDIASWFATLAGLIVFVPAVFLVRRRNPIACFAVALACAIA